MGLILTDGTLEEKVEAIPGHVYKHDGVRQVDVAGPYFLCGVSKKDGNRLHSLSDGRLWDCCSAFGSAASEFQDMGTIEVKM